MDFEAMSEPLLESLTRSFAEMVERMSDKYFAEKAAGNDALAAMWEATTGLYSTMLMLSYFAWQKLRARRLVREFLQARS